MGPTTSGEKRSSTLRRAVLPRDRDESPMKFIDQGAFPMDACATIDAALIEDASQGRPEPVASVPAGDHNADFEHRGGGCRMPVA